MPNFTDITPLYTIALLLYAKLVISSQSSLYNNYYVWRYLNLQRLCPLYFLIAFCFDVFRTFLGVCLVSLS